MFNGIFKFNFLALVVSEIGGRKFTLGALRPPDAPSADFGQKFMKSFHSGVISPQNPKLGGGSNRHLTSSRMYVMIEP